MMKKYIIGVALAAIFLTFPLNALAVDYLAEADKIFDEGGVENFKKSIELYQKDVEQQRQLEVRPGVSRVCR
ncbi:MAG: hypothetical protein P8X68_04820 [Desulfobacterales bacterium]